MSKYANYNANLGNRARQLRRDMTRHEKHLWYDFLSTYPAAKWRRLRPVENYIVDFYCTSASARLKSPQGISSSPLGEPRRLKLKI